MASANQILAENLKALMELRGFNNLTLGKAAGLAPNTVKNYLDFGKEDARPKSGKPRSAKLAEVEMLAAALKVSLIDLLTERGVEARPAPILTKAQQQILLDLDDIAPPKQSKIIDMVRQQAEEAREAADYHQRKRATSAAEARSKVKSASTAPVASRRTGQRELPLSVVDDPFRAAPGEREAALYERIERAPKARRKTEKNSTK